MHNLVTWLNHLLIFWSPIREITLGFSVVQMTAVGVKSLFL